MNDKGYFFSELLAGFPGLPPRQARQRTVYWGAILLATALIGFTARYIQHIPVSLKAELGARASHHPGLPSLINLNGRDVILRGEVESDSAISRDLELLASTPGVRSVRSELEIVPRPAPVFRLQSEPDRVSLSGRLAGDDLDPVIDGVRGAFPNSGIRDRIKIDDRLGSPLWTKQLLPLLQRLKPLDTFSLFAWRDSILIDGVAPSRAILDEVRYSAPVGLDSAIRISFRLQPAIAENTASFSLVAGWNGTALSGSLRDETTARSLRDAVKDWNNGGQPASVSFIASTAEADPGWLEKLPGLLPQLSRVHDLRLVAGGGELWLWGRVDHSDVLGEVALAIESAGLDNVVTSRLIVDPADRTPEISLFRDRRGAVISGRLPSPGSRAALLETLGHGMQVAAVEDFTTTEPGIAFSPWLDRWEALLPVMPSTPFGLTISGQRALVSGVIPDQEARASLRRALESMLPGVTLVDWLTESTDD